MTQGAVVRRSLGVAAVTFVALAAMMAVSLGTAAAAGPVYTVGQVPIRFVGTVNLGSYVFSGARATNLRAFGQGASFGSAAPSGTGRIVDQAIARKRHRPGPAVSAVSDPITTTNVPGEGGFTGLTGYEQAVVNHNVDLEPPDQGLCAGNGMVGEFINDAFAVYDPNGVQLLNTVPSYVLFKQPSNAFLSDPRCYYDQSTQRWFLTEFTVGTADGKVPSTQFIAVSNTSDPLSTWSVWAVNTTDKGTVGCPCFGDFDQLGVDNNGIYLATNEFSISPTGPFNGVIIYAVSKQTLEQVANTGILPTMFRYRVTSDPFGQPYHISPASTPPGAKFAPDTEYFVESNSDAFTDHHLIVYAMTGTSTLASPIPSAPPLVGSDVASEAYSFPPDATQRPGAIPLGNANQNPEGQLQADFNAIQEVTYTNGNLYAEAATGTPRSTAGAAWFVITPTLTKAGVTATIAHQGYTDVSPQNVVYPAIAVDGAGNGYMAFTLSGPNYFPSAAYQKFTSSGATGPVIVASRGVVPEDGFTCYSAFVGPSYGGCRWGDYSMGVAMGSRIYMSTEYIPQANRDYLTNWGTLVWHVPTP